MAKQYSINKHLLIGLCIVFGLIIALVIIIPSAEKSQIEEGLSDFDAKTLLFVEMPNLGIIEKADLQIKSVESPEYPGSRIIYSETRLAVWFIHNETKKVYCLNGIARALTPHLPIAQDHDFQVEFSHLIL